MSVRQVGRLGLRLAIAGAAAYIVATVATTVWFERVFLPRIAGED